MVFTVKLDFTRKARMCARGNLTEPPKTLTYSSVVSRESVCIAFLLAALNDVDLMMFDVSNAYLNAPILSEEKYYCYAGSEFGEEKGDTLIVVKALYGLKSSGAAYHNFFAQTLRDMGFESCYADTDVWRRAAIKPNGDEYYEYILTYVDDCLVLSHKPTKVINAFMDEPFNFKLKDVEPPSRYLGAAVGKHLFGNHDNWAWFMSADLYLEKAITEIERKWGPCEKLFKDYSKLDIPIPSKYHPETDNTKFLDDDDIQLYQSYIGIIRWAVELGCIDICRCAGVMATYMTQPREGHMYYTLRIFAYLKKHLHAQIEPREVLFDDIDFPDHDWKDFYPHVNGETLPLMLPHRGAKQFRSTCLLMHPTLPAWSPDVPRPASSFSSMAHPFPGFPNAKTLSRALYLAANLSLSKLPSNKTNPYDTNYA